MAAPGTEERLNELWKLAPELEKQGRLQEALAAWKEALDIKVNVLGITGAGDVGECDAIDERIKALEIKLYT